MRVLTLNCGSSSIKYELRDVTTGTVLTTGVVSRIGEGGSGFETRTNEVSHTRTVDIPDYGSALKLIVESLLDSSEGVLHDISEINAVGHRVVHGGSYFTAPVLLTDEVIARIEESLHLAPLHNPPTLEGIREAVRLLPHVPQVAVFDTAFHVDIPAKAHVYALPYRFYEENDVRRYGFHGISFSSVAGKTDEILGGTLSQLKVVIAHLGNGASIAAVAGGISVDTSMGFTPIEGLVMGTRSGDVDPGVVLFLMRGMGLSLDEVDATLNKASGLLGLSGVSNDMRGVKEGAAAGDERCRLALDTYAYRVKKYIGAFAAAMGGLDVLVFTAGVGENDVEMRASICEGLGFLGIKLDAARNAQARGEQADIGASQARVRVLVVPTDEEEFIAQQTVAVVTGSIKQ